MPSSSVTSTSESGARCGTRNRLRDPLRPLRTPPGPLVTSLPGDAWSVVFDSCDVECLVTLRGTCPVLQQRTEEYARRKAQGWGWRKGDGVSTWVERLGRRVCVFETKTFRCLDSNTTQITSPPPTKGLDLEALGSPTAAGSSARALPLMKEPLFSEHGSKVRITTPGRYLVCATAEPRLSDVPRRKRPREDHQDPPVKRQRLSFKVRVGDRKKGAPLKSSVYVGVATRAFSEVTTSQEVVTRPPPQAVRSSDAWLVDLRRGRFVHAYPEYDRRVAATRGMARARALASTDEVAKSGDVVGVRVVDDSVFFYKNGSRLAFGCGGGVFTQSRQQEPPHGGALGDHLGWGRPLPNRFLDEDHLVPVVEVHAKPDAQNSVDLELEIANWNPDSGDDEPFFAHVENIDAPTVTLRRRFDQNDSETSLMTPPPTTWVTRLVGSFPWVLSKRRQTSLRRCARSLVARVPAAVGLAQLSLDLVSLALKADEVRSVRAFCDAFALSVAVSTVWKTHFYDHRRPRRSRRGLRILLKVHLFKCIALAVVAAGYLEPRFAKALVVVDDHDVTPCARALPRAVAAAAAWLVAEVAVECFLQVIAFLDACRRQVLASTQRHVLPSICGRFFDAVAPIFVQRTEARPSNLLRPPGLAAALRNFPVGHDSLAATARAVVRFFFMIFIVPGSASLVLALAKDRFLAGCAIPVDAHLLDAADLVKALFYPMIAAWWCFALFVKFGFLVFGLHALCGFEDFYAPGWLLG